MIPDRSEVIDLLTSITLSAYHAQRPDLLLAIVSCSEAFVQHAPAEEQASLYHRMARIWCAKFDLFILQGAPDTGKSHADTLHLLNTVLKDHFAAAERFFDDPLSLEESDVNQNSFAIEGRLRLHARRVELEALTKPRADGEKAYKKLMEFDNAFSSLVDRRRRGTLGGRTARRYIRYPFRDPVFLGAQTDYKKRQEIFNIVSRLMDLNTDRLGRFSGAERVGAMLDAARFNYFSGHLNAAEKYASLANELSYMANVSHNAKLDELVVNADLSCIEAQRLVDSGGEQQDALLQISKAESFVETLTGIALGLSYQPYKGLAKYLTLKIAHVRNQINDDADLRRKALRSVGSIDGLILEIQDISMEQPIQALAKALNTNNKSARFF